MGYLKEYKFEGKKHITNVSKCVHQHIPKTAGTSFNRELCIDPRLTRHWYPADKIPFFVGQARFSVVRNPFDWLVSFYHHFNFEKSVRFSRKIYVPPAGPDDEFPGGHGYPGRVAKMLGFQKDITFSECVNEIIEKSNISKTSISSEESYLENLLHYPFVPMMFDKKLEPVSDIIVFAEKLDESIEFLKNNCSKLSNEQKNMRKYNWGKGLKRKKDYRNYYTDEQVEKLNILWYPILKTFGYSFKDNLQTNIMFVDFKYSNLDLLKEYESERRIMLDKIEDGDIK